VLCPKIETKFIAGNLINIFMSKISNFIIPKPPKTTPHVHENPPLFKESIQELKT
jgi:hypothetical protein